MKAAQVGEIGKPPQTARAQNGVGPHRANARDTQQLAPARGHKLNGSFAQILLRPGAFGIEVKLQITITPERQFINLPAIVAEQKAGLVQAMLSERVG